MRYLLTACSIVTLASGLRAQSFNLDFGSPTSPHGVPSASYHAAGRAGVWDAVGPEGSASLVSARGTATGVSLSFSGKMAAVECDHAQTSGGDDALLDDRLEFSTGHGGVAIQIAGLEPGVYRFRLFAIRPNHGACQPDDLLVRVGTTWESMFLAWNGGFQEGQTHTVHYARRLAGGDVTIQAEGYVYGDVWLSGLQIENLLNPIPHGQVQPPTVPLTGDGRGRSLPGDLLAPRRLRSRRR